MQGGTVKVLCSLHKTSTPFITVSVQAAFTTWMLSLHCCEFCALPQGFQDVVNKTLVASGISLMLTQCVHCQASCLLIEGLYLVLAEPRPFWRQIICLTDRQATNVDGLPQQMCMLLPSLTNLVMQSNSNMDTNTSFKGFWIKGTAQLRCTRLSKVAHNKIIPVGPDYAWAFSTHGPGTMPAHQARCRAKTQTTQICPRVWKACLLQQKKTCKAVNFLAIPWWVPGPKVLGSRSRTRILGPMSHLQPPVQPPNSVHH